MSAGPAMSGNRPVSGHHLPGAQRRRPRQRNWGWAFLLLVGLIGLWLAPAGQIRAQGGGGEVSASFRIDAPTATPVDSDPPDDDQDDDSDRPVIPTATPIVPDPPDDDGSDWPVIATATPIVPDPPDDGQAYPPPTPASAIVICLPYISRAPAATPILPAATLESNDPAVARSGQPGYTQHVLRQATPAPATAGDLEVGPRSASCCWAAAGLLLVGILVLAVGRRRHTRGVAPGSTYLDN